MEKLYTIPLRKEFSKAPNYRRTSRAIIAIRNFIKKHMKNENVKIGKYLNLEMWKHGRKNPPPRIKVKAVLEKIKDKDKEIEYVIVELPHIKIELPKKKTKKEEKKEQIIETKEEEHKTEEEKEKHEVLQKEMPKEQQPNKDIAGKPKREPKIKNKQMIIGRTSKK
jgi:ribosomal protein L31E